MAFYPKQWSFSFCLSKLLKKKLNFFYWSNHVQSVSKHVFSVRVLWHQNVRVFLFFRQFNCGYCCFLPILFNTNQTGKNLQTKPIGTDRIGCVIWLIYISGCCIFNTHFYVAVIVFHLSLISTNYLPHFRTVRFYSVFQCA